MTQLSGESVAEARMRVHLLQARQNTAFEASAIETATGIDVQRPIMHPVWNPLRADDCTVSDSGRETLKSAVVVAVLSKASSPELLSEEATFGGLTSGSLTQRLMCNDTR